MAMLIGAFIASVALLILGSVKSTDVYKDALTRAQTNQAVIGALGYPVREGLLVSGNTNVNGASGETNLAIPISGPKGKGTLYVSATKSLGQWQYSGLVVEVAATGERIDLFANPTVRTKP